MAFGNYGCNPYAYPFYQQPVQQPQTGGIRWVQGEAGAKAYPVGPNESAFLMDSENPMAYLKTTDSSGIPSMRYFQMTEINHEAIQKPDTVQDYATQEELAKIRDDISKLRKAFKALQATIEGEGNE